MLNIMPLDTSNLPMPLVDELELFMCTQMAVQHLTNENRNEILILSPTVNYGLLLEVVPSSDGILMVQRIVEYQAFEETVLEEEYLFSPELQKWIKPLDNQLATKWVREAFINLHTWFADLNDLNAQLILSGPHQDGKHSLVSELLIRNL